MTDSISPTPAVLRNQEPVPALGRDTLLLCVMDISPSPQQLPLYAAGGEDMSPGKSLCPFRQIPV